MDQPQISTNLKAIVQSFTDAVNDMNWIALETLVSPNFVRHSRAAGEPSVRSRQQLISFFERERQTFPDARERIELIVAEDPYVAVLVVFSGTQLGALGGYPPSAKRMVAPYLCIYRIEGGLIVEAWAEWDNLAGFQQLGHFPPSGMGRPEAGGR